MDQLKHIYRSIALPLVLFMLATAMQTNAFSQDIKREYAIFYVEHVSTDNGINNKYTVELGEGQHSLRGIISTLDNGKLEFRNVGAKSITVVSEVDLLHMMDRMAWGLVANYGIQVDGKHFSKYLFQKEER